MPQTNLIRGHSRTRGCSNCTSQWGQSCWSHISLLKVSLPYTKGQLISKCLFVVFNFFQKTNKNKSTCGIIIVKANSFVHFLKKCQLEKNHIDFVWPLVSLRKNQSKYCFLIGLQLKNVLAKMDWFSITALWCNK